MDVSTGASTPIGHLPPEADGVELPGRYGLVGFSEDLSYVYFVSEEVLAPGGIASERNLYLDHEGAKTYIGPLPYEGGDHLNSANPDPELDVSEASPDGRHLAFSSKSPALAESVAGYDNTDAITGEPDMEVYLYEAGGSLVCVSCNPSGSRPSGGDVSTGAGAMPLGEDIASYLPHGFAGGNFNGGRGAPLFPPHALSDSGHRVFFNSFDSVVPEDTNGTWDVYEWEAPGAGDCTAGGPTYSSQNGGCVSLVSTGQSSVESAFAAADPEGRNVFFHTTSGLDPRDAGSVDIYDARIDGGSPSPAEPPACEGDSCQSVPEPPQATTPSSAAFRGPGNLNPVNTRSCARPARRAQKLSRRAKLLRRHGKSAKRNGKSAIARKRGMKATRLARRAKGKSNNAKRCRRARLNRRAHR